MKKTYSIEGIVENKYGDMALTPGTNYWQVSPEKLVEVLNDLSSRIEVLEGIYEGKCGGTCDIHFGSEKEPSTDDQKQYRPVTDQELQRNQTPSTDVGWEEKARNLWLLRNWSDETTAVQDVIDFITHQKNLSFREGREAKFDVVLVNWQEMERDAKKQARKEVIERVRNWLSIRPDVLIDPSARESLSEMLNSLEGPKN